MTERLEKVILESLLGSDEFTRVSLPFLKDEYFDQKPERVLFDEISSFFDTHNKLPTARILELSLEDRKDLTQDEYSETRKLLKSFGHAEENLPWLLERTEKFCRDKAIYNSIMTSISIMDGRNTKYGQDAIPVLLQEALSIAFDKNVGHDFFEKADDRFDFYHTKEDRIPFTIEMFNKITKGGLPRKSLSCILAGVNTGKSLLLCDYAASSLRQGYNVLYITMEMAEERIAERIDCNLLDIDVDSLHRLEKDEYIERLNSIEHRTNGKLIIKEYPTGSAHVGHFKALLEELRSKKNFTPDVICVDYMNICASQKYKSNNYNSYFAVKAIAEELRGLAVETNTVMITATQSTRTGVTENDLEMTDVSESFGSAATVDFLIGMMRTEELDAMGKLLIKQLKSRFGDVGYYRKFVVGVDISKFKLHDAENPTADLVDTGPAVSQTPFDRSKFKRATTASDIDFS